MRKPNFPHYWDDGVGKWLGDVGYGTELVRLWDGGKIGYGQLSGEKFRKPERA